MCEKEKTKIKNTCVRMGKFYDELGNYVDF